MKRIILVVMFVITVMTAVACGCSNVNSESKSMFTIVEGDTLSKTYMIVYHNDTKVMYAVSDSGHSAGIFTVMVNPDGSPMLWKED